MGNMSYIRFENTNPDLEDCFHNWNDAEGESEIQHRKDILELCIRIVKEYAYDYELLTYEQYERLVE